MKPLDKLSARELETLEAKRGSAVLANNRALIDAGFGSVRGNDIRAMNHPLAEEYRQTNDAWQATLAEIAARRSWSGTLKPIKRVA